MSLYFLQNLAPVLFCELQACVELSRNVGQLRTETELLPQCWEQVHSIYSLMWFSSPGWLNFDSRIASFFTFFPGHLMET